MLSNLQKYNHLLNDDNLNRSSMNGNYATGARSSRPRRFVAQSSAKEVDESKSQSAEAQRNEVCVKNRDVNGTANTASIVDAKECEQTSKSELEAKVECESQPQDGGEKSDEKECNLENSTQSTTA